MDENLFQPSSEVFRGNTTFQEFFFKSCLPKLMDLITHLNKRLVLSLTAVAIIVLLFAVVTQVERGGTPSSVSSVSSVTSSSSSSSRSSTSFPVILGFLISGFEENQGTLLASPSAPLNYSLVVTRFNNRANQVRLSAMSTVPGVSVAVSPRNFSFFGDREAVTLGISVDSSVNSMLGNIDPTPQHPLADDAIDLSRAADSFEPQARVRGVPFLPEAPRHEPEAVGNPQGPGHRPGA